MLYLRTRGRIHRWILHQRHFNKPSPEIQLKMIHSIQGLETPRCPVTRMQ
jgi:hypothetical protein